MAEIYLQKMNGALYPAGESDREAMAKYPLGTFLKADIVRPRNYKFHKKFFALLNIGFDAWEPPAPTYKGHQVQKDFDRFRQDVTIAAGFYDVVGTLSGKVALRAKSISFAKMEEDEFNKLYNAVANVLLLDVLKNYTKADVDHVVETICGF